MNINTRVITIMNISRKIILLYLKEEQINQKQFVNMRQYYYFCYIKFLIKVYS